MIGIIFIGNLKYCPYLSKYTEILEKMNMEYQVLFWDREANDESANYPENYIGYNKKSKLKKNKFLKILDFIIFKIWVNKKIVQSNYSGLILLSTLSGMIVYNTLMKKYKNKYIFDIRDYSYEKIGLFFKLEKNIIHNSFTTILSSEGFKEFLPKGYNYIISHNFLYNDLNFKKNKFKIEKKYGDTLNLVWLGSVRYANHQKKILNNLKNDKRFNIIYHGSGPDLKEMISYCKNEQILNVIFTGAYKNTEKNKLLLKADLLNNSYGTNAEENIKYALANKYYDGIIFKIPQLVEYKSYKQYLVDSQKIGISIDISDELFADNLYNYYFNIKEDEFNENCDFLLDKVLKEDKNYLKIIEGFVIVLNKTKRLNSIF